MADTSDLLLKKLNRLPPQKVAEVEDFVDFLRTRDDRERAAAGRRLGEAMAKLDALDLPPMSPEEVQSEIDAARAERRAALVDAVRSRGGQRAREPERRRDG